MSTTKFRCSGCKQYFLKEEAINVGVSKFCSVDCKLKSSKKPAKRRTDIPVSIREQVLKRDGMCRFCNTRSDLHVHHIMYRSQGGVHECDNLITLCNFHHDLVHSDKGRYMKLCQGVIWLGYLGHRISIPSYESWVKNVKVDE
jgi:hypothetical protein